MTIEVMRQALEALEAQEKLIDALLRLVPGGEVTLRGDDYPMGIPARITALRQAISQPDCRGCEHCDYDAWTAKEAQSDICLSCTNGDKFQAFAPVRLYITKGN